MLKQRALPIRMAGAFVALLLSPLLLAEQGKRVALLIGNDAYSIRPLQNAVNDARAMEKALRGAGFRTILRENATKVSLEQAAAEFLENIGPEDTALFFYAGHAVQIENENVLIPVDFTSAKTLIEAKFRSFSLALFFDFLKKARAKTTIVIVDACRNNPVAQGHSLQAGLAQPMATGKDTYIAFSTSPNHVANDNPDGRNSWFTEALADAIVQPGLTLDDVFIRVRMKVENATRGEQTPWSTTSLTSKFYFHPPANLEALNDASMSGKWLEEALKHESRGNWEDAIATFNRILKQAPGTSAERAAREELPYAIARKEAASKIEANEFAAAAQKFEEAFRISPFAFDSGLAAANSYLINDQMPNAVTVLKAVRQRGDSATVRKVDAMLKEIAAVIPEAGEELKRGIPSPPPISEIFPGSRFGVPTWENGRRIARQTAVDLSKWNAKMPLMSLPMPRPEALAPAVEVAANQPPADSGGPITIDSFYVDVQSVAASRDLSREEFGELQIQSAQPKAAVMLDGKAVARQLPITLKVPAGKYDIRTVDRGKTISTRQIEVQPGRATEVSFP